MRLRIRGADLQEIIEREFSDKLFISATSYSPAVMIGYWLTRNTEDLVMPLDPLYIFRPIKAQVSEKDKGIFIKVQDIKEALAQKGIEIQYEIDGDTFTIKHRMDLLKTNIEIENTSLTMPDIKEEGVVSLKEGFYAWSFQKIPEKILQELNNKI